MSVLEAGPTRVRYEFGDSLLLNWTEAEAWCNDNHNAHLASIRNQYEYRDIVEACEGRACWLGLHRNGRVFENDDLLPEEELTWTWSDGTALTYGFELCTEDFCPLKAVPHTREWNDAGTFTMRVDPWMDDHPESSGMESCTFISGHYCERYHENPDECPSGEGCRSHGEGGHCDYITTNGGLYDKICLEVDSGNGRTLGIFSDSEGNGVWKYPQPLCAIKGMCRCFVL